jgi:hypothetical protein
VQFTQDDVPGIIEIVPQIITFVGVRAMQSPAATAAHMELAQPGLEVPTAS